MRKNKTFCIVLLLVFCVGSALSQPPDTVWTYTYAGPIFDGAHAIALTPDGGFVVAGRSWLPDSAYRAVLIRLDGDGHEVWFHAYHRPLISFNAVVQTRDCGFAMVGYCGLGYMSVVKADSAGGVQWTTCPVMSLYWAGEDIVEVSDGGFAALTYGDWTAEPDIYLVRLNSAGDTLWTRRYGGPSKDQGGGLLATPDGGFLIAGSRSQLAYVVKTDSLGIEEWSLLFGDSELRHVVHAVCATEDGDYVVVGERGQDYAGFTLDPFAARISSTGDTIWTRAYAGFPSAGFFGVTSLPGGNLVFGGSVYGGDFLVMMVEPDGDTLWTAHYGTPLPEELWGMCLTSDGGLALAGNQTAFDGQSTQHIWVVRTENVLSLAEMPEAAPSTFRLLPCYPNPFNSITHLEFTLPSTQRVSLRLYDVLGREVAVMMNEIQTAGKHEMMFDASGLPSGVYLCRLEAGGMGVARKMVLVK